MPLFEVTCSETWITSYRVKASTAGEAIRLLMEGISEVEERDSEKSESDVIAVKLIPENKK